jgi:ribonucleoside-diphosphate reductase alpha chain
MNAKVNVIPSTGYTVKKRDGRVVPYNNGMIRNAVLNCLLDVEGLKKKGLNVSSDISNRIHDEAQAITKKVEKSLFRYVSAGGPPINIEAIQDQVELAFMRDGSQKAARSYVLFRDERRKQRELSEMAKPQPVKDAIKVLYPDGSKQVLDEIALSQLLEEAVDGVEGLTAATLKEVVADNLYDGIKLKDYRDILVMSASGLIESDPGYSMVTARILLNKLRYEVLGALGQDEVITQAEMAMAYPEYFKTYIKKAIAADLMDPELGGYDLDLLAACIVPERDMLFSYLGLQTLFDRYLLHVEGKRIEMPQAFLMRVAMGLAINETEREVKTIEFYNLLSSLDFMSSTPTLFNSGTLRPQLSSCYLSTVPDDLKGIFGAISDNALMSKYAGGLGNDWTSVRGLGSLIKGTNGQSQGVVPFLKVANDTAVAVNQGGKRKGAVCAYLETWHVDIEEFLDLRKNVGDDRRRTHDMNTANWIPDLFMKRVAEKGDWTLFSPDEVPDLHDLVGDAFEKAYVAYEAKAKRGEINVTKTVAAVDLWRKMIGMVYETGHPWITFKDPSNIRYSNQHEGVVHSSNLCTEIMLHSNETEIAVCNLGSINLPAHIVDGELDLVKLEKTITTAMRMLDNVIDYNFYNVPQARTSNLKHRPVGMGLMGFQDALYLLGIPYGSEEAVEFADKSMEAISYFAIQASSNLAEERGEYSTYNGSLWSQGILPIDSLKMLKKARGEQYLKVDESQSLDWDSLREQVLLKGMRNSNVMAIAPTATISNICGVSQSIEPMYQNLYVKSNLSGEFTVINSHLVKALKERGLWDEVLVNDLKYYDGSITPIDRIPDDLKALYATAFEMDSRWLIEAAARRQKWIDQGQSLNLYIAEPDGKQLDNIYKLAWIRGLKTTYYLRSMAASGVAKTRGPSEPSSKPSLQSNLTDLSSVISLSHTKPELIDACGVDGGCS